MLLKLSVVKGLSADSDNDTSVALNLITDHRPELTKKQLHTMKGFDSCPLVLFLLSSFFSFHLVFSRLSLLSLLVSFACVACLTAGQETQRIHCVEIGPKRQL